MSKKKVLIITYYYPPAGGGGVQRWLKFCKYLPNYGITPIVLKPKNPSYPIFDLSLLEEIPRNQIVLEIPIWEPYFLAEKIFSKNKNYKSGQFDMIENQGFFSKISFFIRGNFFIPDARKFWITPCYKFLKKYLYDHSINSIITTGPPHSLHLIGLKLKQFNPSLRWISDFRDPWTNISYHKELKLLNLAKIKHQKLENLVLKNSDLVLTTSYSDTEKLKKIGINNCLTITNGFDSEIYSKNKKNKKFTLTYSGLMEQSRNPQILWKVISNLLSIKFLNYDNFQLKFIGKIDEKIFQELDKLNLKKILVFKGYLSYNESLKEIQESDLLLVTNFNSDHNRGIIPGKLFDYFSTKNLILSIGPKLSDVEKLLKKTGCGAHFNYDEKLKIKSFLIDCYNNWSNNKKYNFDLVEIMKFHRKNLTKTLSKFIFL